MKRTFKTILLFSFVIMFSDYCCAQDSLTNCNNLSQDDYRLNFNLNAGASLIGLNFSPKFDVEALYYFNEKIGLKLGTTANYFFKSKSDFGDINWFANIGLLIRASNAKNKSLVNRKTWQEFGCAFLFKNSNYFFKGNTVKLYYSFPIKNKLLFSVDWYFTKDLKRSFPGFSLYF